MLYNIKNEGADFMAVYFYCQCCGKVFTEDSVICNKCCGFETLAKTKYDSEHYEEESIKKYGDRKHWYEFLLPEIKANPLFDENKYNWEDSEEAYKPGYKAPIRHPVKATQHTPHCPTCGSTNLRKIGNLERGLSVTVWGFGSSKLGKTFECKNCGYKF